MSIRCIIIVIGADRRPQPERLLRRRVVSPPESRRAGSRHQPAPSLLPSSARARAAIPIRASMPASTSISAPKPLAIRSCSTISHRSMLGLPTERRFTPRRGHALRRRCRIAPPDAVRVDVVIPVYRGLEATRRCLRSLLRDPKPGLRSPLHRIVVIDDASPEPALSRYLDRLAARRFIHLLRNPAQISASSLRSTAASPRPARGTWCSSMRIPRCRRAGSPASRGRPTAIPGSPPSRPSPTTRRSAPTRRSRAARCPSGRRSRASTPPASPPMPAAPSPSPPPSASACICGGTRSTNSALSMPKPSAAATARRTTTACAPMQCRLASSARLRSLRLP